MAFHAERQARLREKYDRLSDPAQAAVRLYLDGAKPSIIARRLGLTTLEAQQLLFYALQALA